LGYHALELWNKSFALTLLVLEVSNLTGFISIGHIIAMLTAKLVVFEVMVTYLISLGVSIKIT
jgi:hypothetical protein